MTELASSPKPSTGPNSLVLKLFVFTAIVFLGYGALGLPLATLPGQIHEALGYGTPIVGLAVALQSVATLLTRPLAGVLCDTRGGKISILIGTGCFALSGLLYLASLAVASPLLSLGVLLLGRAFAGPGESFIVTGALAWAIAALGVAHTGRVMVWVGIAMYGAVAVGAPLGLALHDAAGFGAVAAVTLLLPLIAAVLALLVTAVKAPGGLRLPFLQVIGLIWRQGTGLALGAFGFGGIAPFIALYFNARGWSGAGLTLSALAGAYVLARLVAGHLPDKLGGAKVARVSLAIEFVGLVVMGFATSPIHAMAGAFLAGAGFALVFPSLGIIAVQRVPPASRGAALGGYVAFFDIGLMVAGPLAGILVAAWGYPTIFFASAIAAALAMIFTRQRGG